MWWLPPKPRFFQFSLRSGLLGIAVLSLLFCYLGESLRAYQREQRVLSQIPGLEVSRPVPATINPVVKLC